MIVTDFVDSIYTFTVYYLRFGIIHIQTIYLQHAPSATKEIS
jgi:hypothetical protein